MKKIFSWAWDNILFLYTLFLLAFIPLYPKLPLINVKNTWVYVRAEDFVVLLVLFSLFLLILKKKVSLKTPLTMPILVFWIIGAIATIHGVVLIFPTAPNVFPNVALLSFLRHIEYMSLFFVAFISIKDKKSLPVVVSVLTITLLLVALYGFGQKYLGFPAYLTMNEEFAKGIPIQLSQLSRIPSTFAGHYDLAAYLVLVIPILVSMVFGIRNWFGKIFLLITSVLGFVILFMTVSRVSFIVLLLVLFAVLFFQKKKLVILSLPLLIIFISVFFTFQPSLLQRFGNTIKEVDVLVDAKTGAAIGNVKFVPREYFKDKIILKTRVRDKTELDLVLATGKGNSEESATPTVLPIKFVPEEAPLVTAANLSTGENLPQGTGYINLPLSPVTKKLGSFFYELPPNLSATTSSQILTFYGDFLVKRAAAYDLSFTTRFQGEWPRALAAFARNVFLGSGYGSVSLAVDNNYFRMLGEIGTFGTLAFFAIFLSIAIYIKKILPEVDSPAARSFVIGFAAGVVGLMLNATLIDVFEASKVAYLLWMLAGVTLGILLLYGTKRINLYQELKKVVVSPYAVALYLLVFVMVIFSPMLNNFFVGDDFTWLRWAASCPTSKCPSVFQTVFHYFTNSDGFFYRPGTKVYFLAMYSVFWLNQVVYHYVSVFLHFIVATLFFLLARKILKNYFLSVMAAFLFVIMSGYGEAVFWISSTGYLFNAVFALSSLLLFISWREKKKIVFYIGSLFCIAFALFFHEVGVIIPLLIILYDAVNNNSFKVKKLLQPLYLALFIPDILYLVIRFVSGSHWLNGDYSYNLLKLPFNVIGNSLGYLALILSGPISLPFYETLRNSLKTHLVFALIFTPVIIFVLVLLYKSLIKGMEKEEKKIFFFGAGFFVITLLPFLGLGNITSRYSYLASLGVAFILVICIRNLYRYLLINGKDIAITATIAAVVVFSLVHIVEVQQLHADWGGAGARTKTFFTAIDELYGDNWSKEPVEFHFVNVPTKVGEAWIFPVGLPDAIWFTFRNPDLKIYEDSNLKTAVDKAAASPSTIRVFQFQEDGSVVEIKPYEKSPVNPQ